MLLLMLGERLWLGLTLELIERLILGLKLALGEIEEEMDLDNECESDLEIL